MNFSHVQQRISSASVDELREHLLECDGSFKPPLSARLDIGDYAAKLKARAHCVEAWQDRRLVGLVALYLNRDTGIAFVSNVSTVPGHEGRGIARGLMERALEDSDAAGCHAVSLEVSRQAPRAIALYRKLGFVEAGGHSDPAVLSLTKSTSGRHTA